MESAAAPRKTLLSGRDFSHHAHAQLSTTVLRAGQLFLSPTGDQFWPWSMNLSLAWSTTYEILQPLLKFWHGVWMSHWFLRRTLLTEKNDEFPLKVNNRTWLMMCTVRISSWRKPRMSCFHLQGICKQQEYKHFMNSCSLLKVWNVTPESILSLSIFHLHFTISICFDKVGVLGWD